MSDAETPQERDSADAAEYALGLLTAEEIQSFEARLIVDPGLRSELSIWQDHLAAPLTALVGLAPRPEVKARIAKTLGAPQREASREPANWWRGLSGIAAALAIGFGIALYQQSQPTPPGPLLAGAITDNDQLMVHFTYDPSQNWARVTRISGGPEPDQALQLWAIPPETGVPVSLGVLPPTGSTQLTLPDPLTGQMDMVGLAVSAEPPGGSPTGQPTGPVLATGQLTDF